MPYARLLDQLIKESGMSAKEVAEKCAQFGATVTPSYISLLRNENRNRTPSDDVSIALAKVFGKREDYLVIERQMDDAPELFKQIIYKFIKLSLQSAASIQNSPISAEQLQAAISLIDKHPMADLLLELHSIGEALPTGIELLQSSGAGFEFTAVDDAMAPIIKKGNKVQLAQQGEYRNGDIIGFEWNKQLYYRQYQKVNETTVLLLAYNPEFPQLIYSEKEMTLMGKVQAVTTML